MRISWCWQQGTRPSKILIRPSPFIFWKPEPPGSSGADSLKKWAGAARTRQSCFLPTAVYPRKNRLGEKGMGFLMLMEKLQQERLTCAVGAVTAAEMILKWITEYCRNTRVSGKPLSKFQATQFSLVEMAAEVKIGRTFVEKLVMEHIAHENVVVETSMAKFWTTDMVNRIADRSLDIMGNDGMLEKFPIARAWRDVRVMSIFAGTNEIMKGIAAKFMGL